MQILLTMNSYRNKNDFSNERVWIIGASSGIGRALAIELANRGANLVLSARSHDKLRQLRNELGQQHTVLPVDLGLSDSIESAARVLRDEAQTIDRVILMAAQYQPMNLHRLDIEQTQKMIDVNLIGAYRVIQQVVPMLKGQGRGQIALCASLAGYRGLPLGGPYSSSKAALIHLAESLWLELRGHGIDVKVINPGFVKTNLTDKNDFAMPFIMPANIAATRIANGLKRKYFEIHFPRKLSYLMKLIGLLPSGLYLRLTLWLTKLQKK